MAGQSGGFWRGEESTYRKKADGIDGELVNLSVTHDCNFLGELTKEDLDRKGEVGEVEKKRAGRTGKVRLLKPHRRVSATGAVDAGDARAGPCVLISSLLLAYDSHPIA